VEFGFNELGRMDGTLDPKAVGEWAEAGIP
jgi:hypothetical protein